MKQPALAVPGRKLKMEQHGGRQGLSGADPALLRRFCFASLILASLYSEEI